MVRSPGRKINHWLSCRDVDTRKSAGNIFELITDSVRLVITFSRFCVRYVYRPFVNYFSFISLVRFSNSFFLSVLSVLRSFIYSLLHSNFLHSIRLVFVLRALRSFVRSFLSSFIHSSIHSSTFLSEIDCFS